MVSLRNNMQKETSPIRFAVMCNGTTFQKWQARCIEKLLEMENIHLVLLIVDDNAASHGIFNKLNQIRLNKFLFQFYSYFFVRPPAIHKVDMSKKLSTVPSINCKTIKKGRYSEYFSSSDINAIHEYNLDFIIRFGFNIIRGDILKVARYGIWSYHHGDEEKYRGSPPCFWEIYNGDSVTGAILQKLTNELDAGIILKKGYFRTTNFSYSRNVNTAFLESARWVAQLCIDIRNGKTDHINSAPSKTQAPIYYAPNNLQMIKFILKIWKNLFSKIYSTLFIMDQWNIGIVSEPIHVFLNKSYKPEINFLPYPGKGGFIADPFGIIRNEKLTILCEHFDYSDFKGLIAVVDNMLLDKKSSSQPKAIIEMPVHMSYPYLFEYNGEIYCIPETHQLRESTLFKAKNFPYEWVKVTTIIKNFACVDATVFQYNRLWWLMCTDADIDECLNLFIWHAPALSGPWEPHVSNPVKTDIRSSRPAGTPFISNGNLYRPSQDCSDTYGKRIVLNRVIKLTPTEFDEEEVSVVGPYFESDYPDGVHTLSSVGNITLIDCKRIIFIGSDFKHTFKQGIRYILRG